jgi:hypothetical protein
MNNLRADFYLYYTFRSPPHVREFNNKHKLKNSGSFIFFQNSSGIVLS